MVQWERYVAVNPSSKIAGEKLFVGGAQERRGKKFIFSWSTRIANNSFISVFLTQ